MHFEYETDDIMRWAYYALRVEMSEPDPEFGYLWMLVRADIFLELSRRELAVNPHVLEDPHWACDLALYADEVVDLIWEDAKDGVADEIVFGWS